MAQSTSIFWYPVPRILVETFSPKSPPSRIFLRQNIPPPKCFPMLDSLPAWITVNVTAKNNHPNDIHLPKLSLQFFSAKSIPPEYFSAKNIPSKSKYQTKIFFRQKSSPPKYFGSGYRVPDGSHQVNLRGLMNRFTFEQIRPHQI